MIFFVQDSPQHAITHFMAHYHTERIIRVAETGSCSQVPLSRRLSRYIAAGA